MPPEQTRLVQSVAVLQDWPTVQGEQVEPPQSMSVSSWFWTASVQVGAAQMLAVQTPLAQSVASAQAPPSAQGSQEPPQSTSVSSWFSTPSEQLGAWQTLPTHTPLRQSAPVVQPPPAAQPVQVPPQSTPVSVPFCVLSLQVAA